MTKRPSQRRHGTRRSQSGLVPPAASSSSNGSSSSSSSGSPLVGAGSTLVAPLMSKWQSDYSSKTEETVTDGRDRQRRRIDQITSRSVDFGASDAPLTAEQFKEANGVEQIPVGAERHPARLQRQRCAQNLELSGEVLADIYLGKITCGRPGSPSSIPAPASPAPDHARLPQDGSGDTYAFTNYLDDRPRIQVEGRHLDDGQLPDRRRRRKERRVSRPRSPRPTGRSATSVSPTRSPTNSACR